MYIICLIIGNYSVELRGISRHVFTQLGPQSYFWYGELHIILNLRHLKIGEHSSFFNDEILF